MITNAACNKCTFFDSHANQNGAPGLNDGLCRYNPPVTQSSASEHGLWPVVSTNDWCGHFAPDAMASQVAAE